MTFATHDAMLAQRFKALAHPARLAIVRALMQTERCSCAEIVRALPLAQSTVSQHLKVLREAGIIYGEAEGPRSCYGIDPAALADVAAAMELLARSGAAAGNGR